MSTQARQAQDFRDRVIASEIEKLPRELLELLDKAEKMAEKLQNSKNRLLQEEQKQIVETTTPVKRSRRLASRRRRDQDQEIDEPHGSKRKSDQAKTSNEEEQKVEEAVAHDPRSLNDRLDHLRQPTQMCAFGTLEPHQFESLKWLAALDDNDMNGLLADDMGLGKTVQTIAFICYLWETKQMRDRPHLVIAPKSTISNWMKEFRNWAPELRVVNLVPTADLREEILRDKMQPGQFDVCVTTYEAIQYVPQLRKNKFNWYLMTFDEAHKLKNSQSITIQLARQIKSRRRLLLTGTPLQNNVMELWSLLNFMMPDIFSDSDQFESWFNFNRPSGRENPAAAEDAVQLSEEAKFLVIQILHRILKPFMLRRTKADRATKLPEKYELNIQVGMSPMQIKLYQSLLRSKNMADLGGSNGVLNNLMMQLRKVCNHPYMFEGVEEEGQGDGEHLMTNSGKMIFLEKLLQKCMAQGEQAILFSGFTMMLSIIEDYLNFRGIRYCHLDGSTELADREERIEDFTRPGSDKVIFLISTRAGGLGINLVSANHVVLYDSDWNPQIDLQAMDRAHRIGQRKNVFVYRLITEDSVEEKIVQRQAIKLKVDQVFIQQGRKVSQSSVLNKTEYQKIILHGAQKIMAAKSDMVTFGKDIDIEALIQEGKARREQLVAEADRQAEEVLAAAIEKQDGEGQGGLDLEIQRIDMFKFQDQDFRAVRANFQKMVYEQQIEQQRKDNAELRGYVRPKRAAAEQAMQMMHGQDQHAKFKQAKALENKMRKQQAMAEIDGDTYMLPQKDKSIEVRKVYEFQFFHNLDALQTLSQQIQKRVDNFEVVPNEMKARYEAMLQTGFSEWSLADYKQFFKAFRKREITDFDGIAAEVESKSTEEVARYLRVFLQRYNELKEKDQILLKLQQKDFEEQNLETILQFDHEKAQRGDYVVLLQTNDFFNANSYLALISKAQQKLIKQNRGRQTADLQLKLDHFLHAQAKQIAQEQVKAVASSLRAEEALKKHLHFTNQRRNMKRAIARAKQFASGCEGIKETEKRALEQQQLEESKN